MAALVRASARGVKVKMPLYAKSAFPFREEVKKVSPYKAGFDKLFLQCLAPE